MTFKSGDQALHCLNCTMPMTLVQIDPRVASFAELHTFRCFACGDVRAVDSEKVGLFRPLFGRRASLVNLGRLIWRPQSFQIERAMLLMAHGWPDQRSPLLGRSSAARRGPANYGERLVARALPLSMLFGINKRLGNNDLVPAGAFCLIQRHICPPEKDIDGISRFPFRDAHVHVTAIGLSPATIFSRSTLWRNACAISNASERSFCVSSANSSPPTARIHQVMARPPRQYS